MEIMTIIISFILQTFIFQHSVRSSQWYSEYFKRHFLSFEFKTILMFSRQLLTQFTMHHKFVIEMISILIRTQYQFVRKYVKWIFYTFLQQSSLPLALGQCFFLIHFKQKCFETIIIHHIFARSHTKFSSCKICVSFVSFCWSFKAIAIV